MSTPDPIEVILTTKFTHNAGWSLPTVKAHVAEILGVEVCAADGNFTFEGVRYAVRWNQARKYSQLAWYVEVAR